MGGSGRVPLEDGCGRIVRRDGIMLQLPDRLMAGVWVGTHYDCALLNLMSDLAKDYMPKPK